MDSEDTLTAIALAVICLSGVTCKGMGILARPEPVPVSELAAECRRVMPMCAVSLEAN